MAGGRARSCDAEAGPDDGGDVVVKGLVVERVEVKVEIRAVVDYAGG